MNFGAFNSPEDNILFDINDFDETLPGVDFTVDLKRLAASVAVAAKAANMSDKRARSFAAGTVTAYREHMLALMELSPLEIWHSRIDLEQELKQIESPELRRSLSTVIRHARARRSRQGRQLSASRHRRRAQDRRQAADDLPPQSEDDRGTQDRLCSRLRALPRNAHSRPDGSTRPLSIDGRRFQGGRRRVGRHDLRRRAVPRRRRRAAFLASQAGATLGPRAALGEARLSRPAGQARGRGAADDAGRERHFSRLDVGQALGRSISMSAS